MGMTTTTCRLPVLSVTMCTALLLSLSFLQGGTPAVQKTEDGRSDGDCINACTAAGICSCIPIPRAADQKKASKQSSGSQYCTQSGPMVGVGILQGRRTSQEDVISVRMLPPLGDPPHTPEFFAVFDGHMGGHAAAFAGEKLHSLLAEHPAYLRGEMDVALSDAIMQLDNIYYEKATAEGLNDGSTAVAGILWGSQLTIAHVGDSRAVLLQILCNGTYNAEVLTEDHKPSVERERKRIEANGGFVRHDGVLRVQGQLAVTRAIGHHGNAALKQHVIPVPDVAQHTMMQGDEVLVLASDGLWDVMTPKDVADFVLPRIRGVDRQGCDAVDSVAKALVDEAWDRRSLDNIACVIVDLEALHVRAFQHFSELPSGALLPACADLDGGSANACAGTQGEDRAMAIAVPPSWVRDRPVVSGQRVGRTGNYVLLDMLSVVRSRMHSAALLGPGEGHAAIGGIAHDAVDVPVDMVEEQERQLQEQIEVLQAQLRDDKTSDTHMMYLTLGAAYEALGDWDKAVHYLGMLAEQQQGSGSAELHGRLGLLYQAMANPSKALRFHKKHLELAEAASDYLSAATASGDVAAALRSLGLLDQASTYAHKSRALLLAARDTTSHVTPSTSSALIQAAWAAPDSFSYSKLSSMDAVALALKVAAHNTWLHTDKGLPPGSEQHALQEWGEHAPAMHEAYEYQHNGAADMVYAGTDHHHAVLVGSLVSLPMGHVLDRSSSGGIASEHQQVDSHAASALDNDSTALAQEPSAQVTHAPAKRGPHSVSKRPHTTQHQHKHQHKHKQQHADLGGFGGMSHHDHDHDHDDGHHDYHHGYEMRESIGMGKFGEVWKARQYGHAGDATFVLKRLFVEKGHVVHLSGLREIYFGNKLRGVPHVCRFVESFEEVVQETGQKNLWLVFYNEGLSLRHYLYQGTVQGTTVLYSPSKIWTDTRKSAAGPGTLRVLMQQLLEGVSNCHRLNVTHRDIKPENILVHINTSHDAAAATPVLKLADFGSAVDEYSTRHLYGQRGPSMQDETLDYAPPEVLFGDVATAYSAMRPQSYDIWSVGVIFLELVLGTSKVFQVSQRTRSIIDQRMRRSNAAVREQAYLFRAMVELCIYPPPPLEGHVHDSTDLMPFKCSDAQVQHMLQQRDELGLAFPNLWAVKLLRRLLRWNAEARISADRALKHAFFREDGRGFACARTDSEVEFEDDC